VAHSAVAPCLALWTTKDIFDLVVLKLVTREMPMRMVASIDHLDIGLDPSLSQPLVRACGVLPTSLAEIVPCFHSPNDVTGIVHQIVT
jgi:hypothetical protein